MQEHLASYDLLNSKVLRDIEKFVILERLKKKSFNRTHTAKDLGIGIRTLQRKLKQYGIQSSHFA